MLTHRWHAVAESQFPWEREALDYLRQHLPDAEPVRVWVNAEFVSLDGRLNEVDAIVLTEKGLFLVEIKSRPGEVSGDQQDWVWRDGASEYRLLNPLKLANAKSKRLADLLGRTRAMGDRRVPFIEPLIFASAAGVRLRLPAPLNLRVFGREQEHGGAGQVPGILKALSDSEVGPAQRDRIDASMARVLTRAMEEVGLRRSVKADQVGDFKLGALLFDGPTYQDYEASHVSMQARRRVRLYPIPPRVSAEQRRTVLNAARREVEILEGIRIDGIVRPFSFHETERGPALVFPYDPAEVRLDHFVATQAGRLDENLRLHLLRSIAEVLRSAHQHRLYHRALSPQCIHVTMPNSARPGVMVGNWFSGQRHGGATHGAPSVPGTLHVDALLEDVGQLYVAPEARLEAPNEAALDVFSLGAIAYHLFTGAAPADSLLNDKLLKHGGLLVTDQLGTAPNALVQLVLDATRGNVSDRTPSVDDFLVLLEVVEDEATKPEPQLEVDPVEAQKGDELAHGLRVTRRLGKGSTAVALLVERDDREYVLKVALSDEHNARLRAEGEVLRTLDHPNIVSMHGDPLEIGGRTCLLLDKAGEMSLAVHLREQGPLHLEFLERFGEDLIAILDYLEDQGVAHRDIKPDNLGITPLGRGKRPHLVLFDFSLARESADNIRSGTPPYLEPFLKLRRPTRWDLPAERFAAAVTLHEMATGQLPTWGDGMSDPALIPDEVRVAGDMLDPGVRDSLTAFFQKALARDPGTRFDNAREMLQSWRRVFLAIDQPRRAQGDTGLDPDVDDIRAVFASALEQAAPDTPLMILGVSTRALNALERLGCTTAGQLARLALSRVWALPGVGHKTRRELGTVAAALRERFATSTIVGPDEKVGPAVTTGREDEGTPSVDLLASSLLPKKRPNAKQDSRAVPIWLGFDTAAPWGTDALPLWPNQTEVARAAGVTRARVSQAVLTTRDRWRRDPRLNAVRRDLAEMVGAQGGVVTADELSALLLSVRGSLQDEPARTQLARAVVRAALDVETTQAEPRLVLHRSGAIVLVALDEARAEWAEQLGVAAAGLATRDPLASPDSALAILSEVTPPDGAQVPAPARLVRLAAAVSGTAAVSSRQELYPRGMDAARALKLTPSLFASRGDLTVAQLRERVSSRFADAAALPDRMELDDLLRAAGLDVEWVSEAAGGAGAYRSRERLTPAVSSVTSTLTRFATRTGPTAEVPDEAVLDARAFEDRLRMAASTGQFLVLTTSPRDTPRARQELLRFGVESIDMDALLVSAMQAEALKAGASWDIVLRADAASRDSTDWRNLQLLVTRAMATVSATIAAHPGTVLLTNPGLLARYDKLSLLNDLHQQLGKPGELQGLWVLIAGDGQSALPKLDGVAVPVIGRGQWARIPEAWIRNEHRAA